MYAFQSGGESSFPVHICVSPNQVWPHSPCRPQPCSADHSSGHPPHCLTGIHVHVAPLITFPSPLTAYPKEDLELACWMSAGCFYFSLPSTRLGEAGAPTYSPHLAPDGSEAWPHSNVQMSALGCRLFPDHLEHPYKPSPCTIRGHLQGEV